MQRICSAIQCKISPGPRTERHPAYVPGCLEQGHRIHLVSAHVQGRHVFLQRPCPLQLQRTVSVHQCAMHRVPPQLRFQNPEMHASHIRTLLFGDVWNIRTPNWRGCIAGNYDRKFIPLRVQLCHITTAFDAELSPHTTPSQRRQATFTCRPRPATRYSNGTAAAIWSPA